MIGCWRCRAKQGGEQESVRAKGEKHVRGTRCAPGENRWAKGVQIETQESNEWLGDERSKAINVRTEGLRNLSV